MQNQKKKTGNTDLPVAQVHDALLQKTEYLASPKHCMAVYTAHLVKMTNPSAAATLFPEDASGENKEDDKENRGNHDIIVPITWNISTPSESLSPSFHFNHLGCKEKKSDESTITVQMRGSIWKSLLLTIDQPWQCRLSHARQ